MTAKNCCKNVPILSKIFISIYIELPQICFSSLTSL